jgi:hypothetical protein
MNAFWHSDILRPSADSRRPIDEQQPWIALGLVALASAAARAAALALAFLLSASCAADNQTSVPAAQAPLAPPDPLAAMIRPLEGSTVEQTPPDFSWPYNGEGPYTVNLSFPDGHTEQETATYNWLNWNGSLPAGTYTWTVTRGAETSAPRRFAVGANATPFVVPDMTSVIERLLAKPHPRALPDGATLATMASQRDSALTALRAQVDSNLSEQLPPAGKRGDGSSNRGSYGMKALWSLTAYAYDRTDTYKADAKRRTLNLTSWDPRGATAIDNQESLRIAAVVTLSYDWLGAALSASERSQVLSMLGTRIGDLYDWSVGTRGWPPNDSNAAKPSPIWQTPRDSQRNIAAQAVAAMSAVLVGDIPAASTWVQGLLPFALNVASPWSGEESGYANGTPYGMFDVAASLSAWYMLRWAAGIDLAQKAWVRNYGRFLAYFVPLTYASSKADTRTADPGTPIGLFGDGFAETQLFELRSRLAKGYSHFSPSALGCWYASSLVGEEVTQFEYLMSPPDTCTSTAFPAGTPNSLYLPSIGWMAMHSDLADLNRTSVYFKSSPRPFGGFNHQSADQNAFVINAGGERLAIESGYYVEHGGEYDSDHWQYWVKRTKSKNAITFDGGEGQIALEHLPNQFPTIRYGSITQQESTANYDIVTGDATDAYNGALTKAVRSLVYLRPGTVLVYDNLSSDTARTWEWNIHALSPFAASPNGGIQITKGTQSLCVDGLAATPGQFTPISAPDFGSWGRSNDPTHDVSAAPSDPNAAAQYHGKFASTQPSTSAEIIALLRVGCAQTMASASKSDGVWTVAVGDKTITIAANGNITVTPTSSVPRAASSDTTPPAVSITAPESGATVSGTITVTARAFDDIGVAGVQFKYDGMNIGGEVSAAPYSITGDTRTVANGSYTLTAVARDAAGNLTTSAPVTVGVANP